MLIKIKFSQKCELLSINSKTIDLIEKLDSLCFTVRGVKFIENELIIEAEKEIDCSLKCCHCEYNSELNRLYDFGLDFELISRDYSLDNCLDKC